jgi:hypothetical protein
MKSALLVLITVCITLPSFATTLVLRDGLDGHFSTEDTYIKSSQPDTNYGINSRLVADSGGIQSVIKFSDLIGNGVNQITAGATILDATLQLHVTNTSGVDPTLHQMLVDWSENLLTWNSASLIAGSNGTPGLQSDNVDAKSASIGSFPALALGDAILDVTSVVQNWANGESNFGVLIESSSTDGTEFASSQDDFHVRPMLTVNYEAVPEPGTFVISLLGIVLLLRIGRFDRATLSRQRT